MVVQFPHTGIPFYNGLNGRLWETTCDGTSSIDSRNTDLRVTIIALVLLSCQYLEIHNTPIYDD